MPETDRKEYWLLNHPKGRTVVIARRPEHYGQNVIQWVETKRGDQVRSGSCDFGMFSSAKPGDEIASLLARFRGEGFALVSIRTRLSAAVLRLLRELDALDIGAGVTTTMIRNGWRLEGGGNYSKYTFRELDAFGVIDTGDGYDAPVKILPIGRELARASRRRRASAGGES